MSRLTPPSSESVPSDEVLPSHSDRRSLGQKLVIWGAMSVAGLFAAVVIGVGITIYLREGTPIPFQQMDIKYSEDNGRASIKTPAFLVVFEGQTLSSHLSLSRINVDGRFRWDLWRRKRGEPDRDYYGIKHWYIPRLRRTEFECGGQQVIYVHHQNTLTVNGHEFSTADGQVRLLVKKNGDVVRLADPTIETVPK